MNSDPAIYLSLTARIAAAGILIQTLEVLANAAEFSRDRLLGWRSSSRPVGLGSRLAGALYSEAGCCCVLAVRALAALLTVLLPFGGLPLAVALGVLVATQIYFNRRFVIIAGNCDTQYLICVVAAFAGAIPGTALRFRDAVLIFVAANVAIAYGVAGLDKLRTRTWRSGGRLIQLINYSSYHRPGDLGGQCASVRTAAVLVGIVAAIELLLSVSCLFPTPVFVVILLAGLCFHTLVAVLMGLHGFWWSFAAAYPSLWFAHHLLYHV